MSSIDSVLGHKYVVEKASAKNLKAMISQVGSISES